MPIREGLLVLARDSLQGYEMTPTELRTWRESRGLTQNELARHIGVTERQLSRYETGVSRVPHWLPAMLPKRIKGEIK